MLFAVRSGLITSSGTVTMTVNCGTFFSVLVGQRHCADAGGGQCRTDLEAVCRRQALISWVTRRTRRRERMEMKAISMKATRCPSVRSKMVFNRR
jgi:hypothetical protein